MCHGTAVQDARWATRLYTCKLRTIDQDVQDISCTGRRLRRSVCQRTRVKVAWRSWWRGRRRGRRQRRATLRASACAWVASWLSRRSSLQIANATFRLALSVTAAVRCVVCPDLAIGSTVAQRSAQRWLWRIERVWRARQIFAWHVERVDTTCSAAARDRSAGGVVDGVDRGSVYHNHHDAPQPRGHHEAGNERRNVRVNANNECQRAVLCMHARRAPPVQPGYTIIYSCSQYTV